MTTEYIQTGYRKVKEVLGSLDSGNVWIDSRDVNANWFVDFVYLLTHKTATKGMSTALVASLVYADPLNVSA